MAMAITVKLHGSTGVAYHLHNKRHAEYHPGIHDHDELQEAVHIMATMGMLHVLRCCMLDRLVLGSAASGGASHVGS
jgi:hypothetical protein